MTDKKLLAIILAFFLAVYIAITIMCPWSALLPFRKDFFEVFPEYNVNISEIDRIESSVETNGWGEKYVHVYSDDATRDLLEQLSNTTVQRNWVRSIQCLFMGKDYLGHGSEKITIYLKDGRELKLYIDWEHNPNMYQRINDSSYYCSSGKMILN